MVIKLIIQLIWEAAILPTLRFIVGYAPFIVGVIAANMLTIKYFIAGMIQSQAAQLPGFLEWYIPILLIVSFAFGVMATKCKKIHPAGMLFMLLFAIIMMRTGVVDMQMSLYHGRAPVMFSMLSASIFAVVTIYCVSLMLQRAWVDVLPKRKH